MSLVERHLPTAYRLRWYFLCIGLFAAFCMVFTFIRDRQREGSERKFMNLSRTLVAPAEAALERKDFSKFLAQAKSFIAENKAADVAIFDLRQDCIFHSFYEKASYAGTQRGFVIGEYAAKAVKNESELSWYTKDSGPGDVFFFFPIRKSGSVVGTLQVRFLADFVYGTKGN